MSGFLVKQRISAAAATGQSQCRESESQQRQCGGLRDDLAPRPNIDALVKAAAILEPGAADGDGDVVLIQGHLFLGRQQSAAGCQIAVAADEVLREDIAGERKTVEGRGAANTPIQPDICTVTYIYYGNSRGGVGDECARKQKNPHCGVAAPPSRMSAPDKLVGAAGTV